MPESTAKEALLAELLGDVHALREHVDVLATVIPQAREVIERAGELATLKFNQQTSRTEAMLIERIAQLATAVQDVSATREMLVGAVAIKAKEQARTQLLEAVESTLRKPNYTGLDRFMDRIAVGMCSAAIACALTTWIVLRLISH